MKEVKAVIQPFKLDAVLGALHQVGGLPAVTVSPADAVDTQQEPFERMARVRLELMVPDALVETVVAAIEQAAHTGNPGDGRIFVSPIEATVLIRTGERGEDAR
ncbi:MAG: P-II family nitrogen regulator [Armatimonadetes bacterium]|nr:P-II family nitrogen regulator [Armatimonadota bacterium]